MHAHLVDIYVLFLYLADGNCDQTIVMPCTSVWSVSCLKNGDIIVGSRYIEFSGFIVEFNILTLSCYVVGAPIIKFGPQL